MKIYSVGYWSCKIHPNAPEPQVGANYNETEKAMICSYLNSGELFQKWRGYSKCRLCNERENGYRCFTDWTYRWPEGLSHYVEKHDITLPDDFIDHIKKSIAANDSADD